MIRRAAAVVLVVALCVVAVSGCMTPARNPHNYRDKARMSVQAAASETATVHLVIDKVLAGRMLYNYADQTVSDSEDALSSIVDQFGSVQPPHQSSSDAVQADVSTLLQDASSAVQDARIALRRHDTGAMRDAATALRRQTSKLSGAEDKLA